MDNDVILTRGEMEELCRLFMEGELSVGEERDLAKVLSLSAERGGIIDETVFLLGIQRTVASCAGTDVYRDSAEEVPSVEGSRQWRKIFSRIITASVCAASLIAVVSLGWETAMVGSDDVSENVYTVYIDGKMVSDPDVARMIALESYQENMAMLRQMKEMERQERMEVESQLEIYGRITDEINTYKNI